MDHDNHNTHLLYWQHNLFSWLKFGSGSKEPNMNLLQVTTWLNMGLPQATTWLNMDLPQVTTWLNMDLLQVTTWLNMDLLQVSTWLIFVVVLFVSVTLTANACGKYTGLPTSPNKLKTLYPTQVNSFLDEKWLCLQDHLAFYMISGRFTKD